jgi:hypothetical protein
MENSPRAIEYFIILASMTVTLNSKMFILAENPNEPVKFSFGGGAGGRPAPPPIRVFLIL